MMWHGFDGWGWGMMGIGMVFMVLFWALAILGVVVLIKWLARGPTGGAEKPLDILRERYARGDITREQFEQMKRDVSP
jgi:putative membrane protein